MKNIKLSIIIPVYNTEKYVVRCLESVLSNGSDKIEIIVVNDGTKDRAVDVIRENFDDSRLIIINKENAGLAAARNTGIEKASGEYIQHLDSDDYLDPSGIDLIVDVLCEQTSPDVIVFDTLLVDDDGRKIRYWSDGDFDNNTILKSNEYLSQYFSCFCIPSICNKVIRRRIYIENDISHPENISYGEDGSTTPRLMEKANTIFKLNAPLYNYVQHSSSMMGNLNEEKMVLDYSVAFNIVDDFMLSQNKVFYFDYRIRFKTWYLYSRISSITRSNVIGTPLESVYNEQFKFVKNNNFHLSEIFNFRSNKNRLIFLILYVSKYSINLAELLKTLYVRLLKVKKFGYSMYRRVIG